tara:strand:+ start:580 stop:1119 length:540 start_codon:yes stop_codon:yes gene_type:complete
MAFKPTKEWLDQSVMQGPIPGEVFTTELGSNPMERPPVYTKPTPALLALFESISTPKTMRKVLNLIDSGVPLDVVVSSIMEHFVGEGVTTPQNAMAIAPAFTVMVMRMAGAAGVEITLSTDDEDDELELDPDELEQLGSKDNLNVDKAAHVAEISKEELSELPTTDKGIGLMQKPEGLM